MANTTYLLTVDQQEQGHLLLELCDAAGQQVASADVPYEGHVDNILLTAVDNFLRRNTIRKSALTAVRLGAGIDKNSSLYRIVTSFAEAIAAVALNRRIAAERG